MIAEEFEEADKIISVGFDEATFETLGADGQLFIPTRKSEKFHMRKHTACQRPYYHGHSFYEFIYILSGECVQHFKSPERSLTLKKGQACLFPPGTVHSLEKSRKGDNIIKIEEWCKEQFEGKPEYSRRIPRSNIKGIKTAKEERELGLGKALSNFKQSTIWKNYQEGKEKGLSREEIKQEYGMREGEIALVERYERIIEEYDVKKKITGQSIGQVSYTATVQECDEAQTDLNKLIHEQQEITQKD